MLTVILTVITNPPRRWTACRVIKKPSRRRASIQPSTGGYFLPHHHPSPTPTRERQASPERPRSQTGEHVGGAKQADEATSDPNHLPRWRGDQESELESQCPERPVLMARARNATTRRKGNGAIRRNPRPPTSKNGVGQRWTKAGEPERGKQFSSAEFKGCGGAIDVKGCTRRGKHVKGCTGRGKLRRWGSFGRKTLPTFGELANHEVPTSKGVPPLFTKGCARIIFYILDEQDYGANSVPRGSGQRLAGTNNRRPCRHIAIDATIDNNNELLLQLIICYLLTHNNRNYMQCNNNYRVIPGGV